MTTPTKNSQGFDVWKPSVGIYHKPAANEQHSYGGIIGAFQDIQADNNEEVKTYPHNFAGIIAAIQDIVLSNDQAGSDIGTKPPGGDIIINGDGVPEWIITRPPQNGDLWFDTRQGRLMVAVDNEWYQTNGADGLAIVTSDGLAPEVRYPVPGQFWWDSSLNALYIFDGQYEELNGDIVGTPTNSTAPVWKLVGGSDPENWATQQTTATLPLSVIGPRIIAYNAVGNLPEMDLEEMRVQKDYNEWIFEALVGLDTNDREQSAVTVADSPPDNPNEGDLWYDTSTLDLSVWYDDGDTQQWVPTTTSYTYDESIARLTESIAQEEKVRRLAVAGLSHRIDALGTIDASDFPVIQDIKASLISVEQKVNASSAIDLTPYATINGLNSAVAYLQTKIDVVDSKEVDLSGYALKGDVAYAEAFSTVELQKAKDDLTALINGVDSKIPDVSAFQTQADVAAEIAATINNNLPKTGGTLTGSITMNKEDYATPGFDFSGDSIYSKDAFKFKAFNSGDSTSTFGSTDKQWEYAWNFSSNEDFCWVYGDTNKVFSISKDGAACSQLYLTNFLTNNENGRVLHNKIDVRERLQTYQTALEGIRQAVTQSADFASIKANILTSLASV